MMVDAKRSPDPAGDGDWSDILAPMSLDEFLREHWTRRFVHIPGPPDRLARLFPWEVLNRALEEHRFGPDRVTLVKEGQTVDGTRYLANGQVDARRFMQELSRGATLIFNLCDEVHPPLRALCDQVERFFRARVVFANLYAGWGTESGFKVHWDEKDTLILQVSGRKRWQVWRPTRRDPFTQDVVNTSFATNPAGPPDWEGVLEQGGVLHMPRGWWHVAYPMDTPSLHLTITIKNSTGVDLLHWLANQMKASETARMSLPVLANAEERQAWLERLRQDLAALCTPELIERYLAHSDQRSRRRPSLCLPDLGTDD